MPGRCPRAETGLAIPAGGDGDTARLAVYLIAMSMRLPSSARSKRRGRIIEDKAEQGAHAIRTVRGAAEIEAYRISGRAAQHYAQARLVRALRIGIPT